MNRVLYIITLVLFGIVFIGPALPRLEGTLFPVVRDTEIRFIEPYETQPGWSQIGGVSDKLRACDFLAIEWYLGEPRGRARAQVTFLETTKTREPGRFNWGDWAVQLTEEQLSENSYAVVTHDCHLFWTTKTLFWESPDRS